MGRGSGEDDMASTLPKQRSAFLYEPARVNSAKSYSDFCFCEVFSVVKIFATAQPQLMGKTKAARARSKAR